MSENFSVEERNYFSNGGKINIDMLNRISNGALDSINNINKLLYTSGVLFLPVTISQNFLIEDAGVDVSGKRLINVGYIGDAANAPFGGVAIDNDGRFIVINKNEAYVGWTNESLNYNINTLSWKSPVRPTDPNLATTDGMGPTGKYSRSSGNYNIPLSFNPDIADDEENTNFIYIKYVQVVEQTSASTQTTTDGLNTYDSEVMYKGGYAIRVINPNYLNDPDNPSTDVSSENYDTILRELGYIKIGEVYKDNDSIKVSTSGSIIPTPTTTQYAYFNGSLVGSPFLAYTGGVEYPTITGSYIDLFTHINALGTGNISSTNPHGISAQDIGLDISGTTYHIVSTEVALNTEVYNLSNALLDLSNKDNYRSYDTILINAENATNGSTNVTIRLPEPDAGSKDLRYTIKRIDTNSDITVSVSTVVNDGSNYIEDNTTLVDDTYSVQELGILGETSNCVTLCVGQPDPDADNYNWYII